MVADRPQRLQAASALAAFLNTPAWQEALTRGDYRSDQQIILALETDKFAEVRCRIERYEPPVHVAVYCPSAPMESGRLHFLVLEPASPEFDPDEDIVDVDPESTIGMFCTYMDKQERSVQVRFTRWQPHLVVRELTSV
ncbi:hypothetical protein [Streptosporangium sp. NPDC004631]